MRTVTHAVALASNLKHVVTFLFYAARLNESILTSLTYNYYQLDEQAPNIWLRMANQWRCTDSFYLHICEKDVSLFIAGEMNQTKPIQASDCNYSIHRHNIQKHLAQAMHSVTDISL